MAATTKNKSTKATPEINHIHKAKRKKVTKGYKQRHSIGSRKTKVVTYSETYPIYESVLAIYLENSKKNQNSTNENSKKNQFSTNEKPKEPVDKTPLTPKPSTSNLNPINDCCVVLDIDINQPSTSTPKQMVVGGDSPMVGGKGVKPCISSKVKKDNMSSPKKAKPKPLIKDVNKKGTPKKEKSKLDKVSPSKKSEIDVCYDTKPKKEKKKKEENEVSKKSKLKILEKSSPGVEKKKNSPKFKKQKSKQVASTEDLISLLVNIKRESAMKSHKSKMAERKNQAPKVSKSPKHETGSKSPKFSNSPEKKEKSKNPNKSPENKGEKARKHNEENVQKSKKRKLDQNIVKSRDTSPVKTKTPKLDKDKSRKKDTKNSAKISPKLKLKQKQKREEKKKIKSENMTKSLLDLFSSVKLKREASLNASARVNIMFEKIPPSSKPKTDLSAKSPKCATDLARSSSPKEKSNSEQKFEKPKKSVKEGGKKTPKKDAKTKSPKEKKNPKDKSLVHVKKVKDKSKVKKKDKVVAPEPTCMRRMASLNAQAIMTATKEFEAEASERAARIDRYCVAWQCEPLTTNVSSAAHWVDGLGKTCCVTQTSACFTTSSKPDTVTSEGPKIQAICDSENVEERPASVVDVTTHVAPNPFLPLPPPTQCIGSFFSQSHSCVPPCSGCCGPEGYMSTSQFKSFQLGPLSSLNSLQMMTYGHPTHPGHPGHSYRSAFSVPYNQVGMPHYGFYGNSYYQPTTGPVIQSDPCLMSHHVPVPQAQVKVLIHNPDSSLDHCAFLDKEIKDSTSEDAPQIPVVKRRSSSETKSKSQEKSKLELKPKRKYERKQSKSPSKDEPERKAAKIVKVIPEKPVIPVHGWSWFGEPETKNIPNVTEGPVRQRKCYPAMKHVDGDIINIRDCVLLRSGTRKKDIPYVAKVSALWENPEDGEIMMSLLWYYRPEHTEAGRKQGQLDNELFACKHRDENSVACIDDKGYVLTYNEFCRFKAEQRRVASHLPPRQNVVPKLEENGTKRKRLPPLDVNSDSVFLCRQVYDFRQHRILKNLNLK